MSVRHMCHWEPWRRHGVHATARCPADVEAFSDEPTETNGKGRVSLGEPWCQDPADTPTWRACLELTRQPLSNDAEVQRTCRKAQITPGELDHLLPEESWSSIWERSLSPQARAYEFLHRAGLSFPLNRRGQKAGRMTFVEAGWHPGSSERWAELQDDVSVSLLQAHILQRELPVRVVVV